MLPLNLKPYAVNWIEKECKSSCDISSNDSMNLCIGLHGRLKLSIVGRNQILPKDGVIIISLHMRACEKKSVKRGKPRPSVIR